MFGTMQEIENMTFLSFLLLAGALRQKWSAISSPNLVVSKSVRTPARTKWFQSRIPHLHIYTNFKSQDLSNAEIQRWEDTVGR